MPNGKSERTSLRLVRIQVRIRRTNTVRRHQSGGGEFYRHLTFEGDMSHDMPPEFLFGLLRRPTNENSRPPFGIPERRLPLKGGEFCRLSKSGGGKFHNRPPEFFPWPLKEANKEKTSLRQTECRSADSPVRVLDSFRVQDSRRRTAPCRPRRVRRRRQSDGGGQNGLWQ